MYVRSKELVALLEAQDNFLSRKIKSLSEQEPPSEFRRPAVQDILTYLEWSQRDIKRALASAYQLDNTRMARHRERLRKKEQRHAEQQVLDTQASLPLGREEAEEEV